MGKIRVYELAQKMGIENKELMARLQAIGVDVKSHSAALDEADVKKLQAPPPQTVTTTVQDVQKEEVRVSTSVIRRRPKVVEKQVEVEVVPPPEPTPEPTPAPVAAEPVKVPEAPAPEKKLEEKVEKKVAEKPVVVEAVAPEQVPVPTPAPELKEKVEKAPAPPPEPQRPTANRAVILGRVELPGLTTPDRRHEQAQPHQPGRTERPASMLSKGRPQVER